MCRPHATDTRKHITCNYPDSRRYFLGRDSRLYLAISTIGLSGRIINKVLGIKSLTSGLLLGLFVLPLLPRNRKIAPIIAIVMGSEVFITLSFYTSDSW
jgi:hypothetical protein